MTAIKQEDFYAVYSTDCGGGCGNPSHIMRFQFDRVSPYEMWVDLQPSKSEVWYKRIWLAIKYVLGIWKSDYGHWECASMSSKSVDELIHFLYKYQIYKEKWDKKGDDLTAEETDEIDEEII